MRMIGQVECKWGEVSVITHQDAEIVPVLGWPGVLINTIQGVFSSRDAGQRIRLIDHFLKDAEKPHPEYKQTWQ